MYTAFAILLSLVFCVVPLIPAAFRGHRRALRVGLFTGASVLLCGVLCLLLAGILLGVVLTDAARPEDFKSWAADVFALYARWTGLGAGVLSLLLLTASLTRHPLYRVRAALSAVAAILLLILGGAYGTVAVTDGADLLTPLYLWTVGCACLLFSGVFSDAVLFLRELSREKEKKKKKQSR